VAAWGAGPDDRHELPDGILTFLLTDIEGSTPLWERHRAVMGVALAQLRQPHYLWHVPLFEAGQEVLRGRFDEAERLAQEALALGRRARDPVVAIYHPIVLIGLRWGQGRLPELEETLAEFVDRYPSNLGWRATLAVLLSEAGRTPEARVHFERLAAGDFTGLPRNHLFLYHVAALAIVGHAVGDPARASRLYELLAPYADHNVLAARLPLGTLGSCRQYLGLLAAAMGRWDDALAQFESAVEAHERIGALPLQAISRHHYAGALLALGRPDDRPRAQQHLDWASAVSRRLGMRRLAIGAPSP
jgi:eukaryotic-like serine/threonine-protein kinase